MQTHTPINDQIASHKVQTPEEGKPRMFKPAQYRAKASEYGELANTSTGSEQKRDFQKLEQRFAVLEDNEQWLADNYQNTVHAEQGNHSTKPLQTKRSASCDVLGQR
jgi:hypothetical protein